MTEPCKPLTALPVPPNGRVAAYHRDLDGHGPTAVVHLDGWHSIFRFFVNLLHHQIDIASEARGVLVDMRDHMTPARFDPHARLMLGDDRYEKCRQDFERSWHCDGCEKEIRVGWRYAPTRTATAVCAACCKGFPEWEALLVKRTKPIDDGTVTVQVTDGRL